MKITVITNDKGDIIGTARFPKLKEGDPIFRPIARTGQKVHEIDLPSNLESVAAEELHKELKKHIKK